VKLQWTNPNNLEFILYHTMKRSNSDVSEVAEDESYNSCCST
jgi:hypothetical protein